MTTAATGFALAGIRHNAIAAQGSYAMLEWQLKCIWSPEDDGYGSEYPPSFRFEQLYTSGSGDDAVRFKYYHFPSGPATGATSGEGFYFGGHASIYVFHGDNETESVAFATDYPEASHFLRIDSGTGIVTITDPTDNSTSGNNATALIDTTISSLEVTTTGSASATNTEWDISGVSGGPYAAGIQWVQQTHSMEFMSSAKWKFVRQRRLVIKDENGAIVEHSNWQDVLD